MPQNPEELAALLITLVIVVHNWRRWQRRRQWERMRRERIREAQEEQ